MDSNGGSQETVPEQVDRSVAELVTRISEQASTLVREEIELAKAEMELKARSLARGAVVGGIAGFFVLLALIFAFETIAWGLNDIFGDLWQGFLITTVLLLLLAGLGALIAVKSFQAGAPPTPDQAIEEAKLIREALEHPEVRAAQAEPAAHEMSQESKPPAAPSDATDNKG